MTAAESVAAAATFLWLGMVLAISFLETPLKFRGPRRHGAHGLGIGRLVFKALNAIELVLAALILVALVAGSPATGAVVGLAAAGTVRASLFGPPLRRRPGGGGRPAFARPLRLRRARSGQGDRAARRRNRTVRLVLTLSQVGTGS